MNIAIIAKARQTGNAISTIVKQYDKTFNIKLLDDDDSLLSHDFAIFDIVFINVIAQIHSRENLIDNVIEKNSNAIIICIFNEIEHALNAVNSHVFGIFCMPIRADILYNGLDKAQEKLASIVQELKISITGKDIYIKMQDLLFIEGNNKKSKVCTISNEVFDNKRQLADYCTGVLRYCLVQVHKSYIINIANVKMIESNMVYMYKIDEGIPIGRKYKKLFKEAVSNYEREHLFQYNNHKGINND